MYIVLLQEQQLCHHKYLLGTSNKLYIKGTILPQTGNNAAPKIANAATD